MAVNLFRAGQWADENEVTLDFSRPGKPTDNPFIESFNSFRDECLNVNWFLSVEHAKEKIDAFKHDLNGFRRQSALCGLTPNQVVAGHHQTRIFYFRLVSKLGAGHCCTAQQVEFVKEWVTSLLPYRRTNE